MDSKKKENYEDIEIWRNFLVYHKEVLSSIEKKLKEKDCISLAWYDILIVIEKSGEKKVSFKKLLEETVITKGGVSRTLDRIEEQKLILRKKSQEDGRELFIAITKEGSLEVKKAWQIYKKCIEEYFLNQLTSEEKILLKSLFPKLRKRIS